MVAREKLSGLKQTDVGFSFVFRGGETRLCALFSRNDECSLVDSAEVGIAIDCLPKNGLVRQEILACLNVISG